MMTCRPLAYLGTVLMMWGFVWGIFIPPFILLSLFGGFLGLFFSKDI